MTAKKVGQSDMSGGSKIEREKTEEASDHRRARRAPGQWEVIITMKRNTILLLEEHKMLKVVLNSDNL